MTNFTKIHEIYIFKVLRSYFQSKYKTQRSLTSMVLVYNIIEYFKFRNILELGFCFGQTFGVMLQATSAGSHLTAVDIAFNTELYDKFFKDSIYTQNKTIEFLNIDTKDFIASREYDFINVDANLPNRFNDMIMAVKCLSPNGILMVDNYAKPEVDPGIDKFLKLDHGLVPFLIDEQAIYFCKNTLDVSYFLDSVLEEQMSTVASLYNIDYKNYFIKSVYPVGISPWALESNPEVYLAYCKQQNI